MSIAPGKLRLGPENGELLVHTGREGGARKAGHDLEIEATSWNATLDIAEDLTQSSGALSVDGGSLRVREGHGGISKLDDSDKQGITRTIDEEILEGGAIEFRSTSVEPGAGSDQLRVRGELELNGIAKPVEFSLLVRDNHLTGEATLTQSGWGIKPYSTLFGALKVADEVKVTIDAQLPA